MERHRQASVLSGPSFPSARRFTAMVGEGIKSIISLSRAMAPFVSASRTKRPEQLSSVDHIFKSTHHLCIEREPFSGIFPSIRLRLQRRLSMSKVSLIRGFNSDQSGPSRREFPSHIRFHADNINHTFELMLFANGQVNFDGALSCTNELFDLGIHLFQSRRFRDPSY